MHSVEEESVEGLPSNDLHSIHVSEVQTGSQQVQGEEVEHVRSQLA